jgi:hypothetical protein
MEGQFEELASVLSLSLHRLQRMPRAMHRAFLSRPSIFRHLRNIKGRFPANTLTFLGHQRANEICLSQLISRARYSIVVVSDHSFFASDLIGLVEHDHPHIRVSRIHAENGECLVIVDDALAWLGAGDVGIALEGEIAQALSDCFRLTMHRNDLKSHGRGPSSWPVLTRIDLENIEVAISRTWTSKDLAPVIENERLLLAALRSARRFIYAETEALTSPVIVNAIASRIRKSDAPEIVIVLPEQTKTRLQFLQRAALARIQKADEFGRFRAYSVAQNVNGLLIVDDQFVKIGNAQMTSSSLGASRAVDVSIEALGRPSVVMSIARLRRERIGRWLTIDASEFDARFLINGSLIGTIESFFTVARYLDEIRAEATLATQIAFTFSPWLDPKRPQAFKRWVRRKLLFGPKSWLIALILLTFFALLVMTM